MLLKKKNTLLVHKGLTISKFNAACQCKEVSPLPSQISGMSVLHNNLRGTQPFFFYKEKKKKKRIDEYHAVKAQNKISLLFYSCLLNKLVSW